MSAHDEGNPNASGSIVLCLNYKGAVLPSIPAISVYVHTYTVSHPKVQTLSNRTPDAQPAIAMEGGAADRNHSGEGQGGTHTTGNHRGEGGYHGVGGEGGLAALHHIYIYIYMYIYLCVCNYRKIYIQYIYIYICPRQGPGCRAGAGV